METISISTSLVWIVGRALTLRKSAFNIRFFTENPPQGWCFEEGDRLALTAVFSAE